MKRLVLPVIAALLVLAVPGCAAEKNEGGGGSHTKDKFNVILDYFPNADHAGIYAAQAAGDYDRAGLDVDIKPPPDPSAPLKLLRTGQADVVISYEPELLLARDKGSDLVVRRGARPEAADHADDARRLDPLARGPARQARRHRRDPVPDRLPADDPQERRGRPRDRRRDPRRLQPRAGHAVAQGRRDLGAFWNYEGTDLRRRGRKPTILRMEKLGVPTYNELIFVARRKDLSAKFSSKLRRFLRATAEGHKRLREHPEVGVDALLKVDPGLDRGLQTDVVSETLPVFFPTDKDKPFGWQEPSQWKAYGEWMYQQQLLKRPPDAQKALTNEFLPGEGLAPSSTATP